MHIYSTHPMGHLGYFHTSCWMQEGKDADYQVIDKYEAVTDDFGDLHRLLPPEDRRNAASVYPAHGVGARFFDIDDDSYAVFWPGHPLAHPPAAPEPLPLPEPKLKLGLKLDPLLQKLHRRLTRWELPHLRALAAQQAERIEELERALDNAEASLDFWHSHALDLQNTLHETGAGQVGLTQAGELLTLPPGNAQTPQQVQA